VVCVVVQLLLHLSLLVWVELGVVEDLHRFEDLGRGYSAQVLVHDGYPLGMQVVLEEAEGGSSRNHFVELRLPLVWDDFSQIDL